MADEKLLEKTGILLLKKGFAVKGLSKSCFDLVARKGGRILLVKILQDANSISDEHARQMHNLGNYAIASPLIVAEKAGSELKDNVIYSRLGIYTLNFSTFRNCIEEKLPFVESTNAGLAANVLCGRLRERREELGLSPAELSKKIGVSRRMISRYEAGDEDGKAQLTMAKAERVYSIFGHDVFDKIDIFRKTDFEFMKQNIQTPITKKYSELGFEASEARKVPFDIIARKDDELILTEVGGRTNPQMASLSMLLDANNLLIFDRKKPKDKDIPAIAREEFMGFEEADELMRFLREF